MNILSWLGTWGPIESLVKFFRRKPFFKVAFKKIEGSNSEIWVKNMSSCTHSITNIKGEPEDLTIKIVDRNFVLPIQNLNPGDEKFIPCLCHIPESNSGNIIKVYSVWEGKEIEAGRVIIPLE